MRLSHAFDRVAPDYDRWYDRPEGKTLFTAEKECFNAVCDHLQGRWLEVGAGTGRFSSALGIGYGIDSSPRMLEIAVARGLNGTVGSAGNLPYPGNSFDGILMALTFCFIDETEQALQECRRVLCSDGLFLLGIVPADSRWGENYIRKAAKGHPLYSAACFRTTKETVELIECAGFKFIDGASTLFWKPGAKPRRQPRVKAGIVQTAGFVSLLFRKTGES